MIEFESGMREAFSWPEPEYQPGFLCWLDRMLSDLWLHGSIIRQVTLGESDIDLILRHRVEFARWLVLREEPGGPVLEGFRHPVTGELLAIYCDATLAPGLCRMDLERITPP